jgi:DNA repair protein RadD
MVGRGFRLCEGKKGCLVLDFGGNVLRHGPVDAIRIRDGRAFDFAPAKECPQCHTIVASGYSVCPECGHEFFKNESSRKPNHDKAASSADILSGEVTDETCAVQEMRFSVHVKRNAPPGAPRTMRVEYRISFHVWQSEWVCFEHTGYARQKAELWWRRRSTLPVPQNVEDAVQLAESGALAETKSITIRHTAGEEYARIIGYELGDKPDCREPGWNDVPEGEFAETLSTTDDSIPF